MIFPIHDKIVYYRNLFQNPCYSTADCQRLEQILRQDLEEEAKNEASLLQKLERKMAQCDNLQREFSDAIL